MLEAFEFSEHTMRSDGPSSFQLAGPLSFQGPTAVVLYLCLSSDSWLANLWNKPYGLNESGSSNPTGSWSYNP